MNRINFARSSLRYFASSGRSKTACWYFWSVIRTSTSHFALIKRKRSMTSGFDNLKPFSVMRLRSTSPVMSGTLKQRGGDRRLKMEFGGNILYLFLFWMPFVFSSTFFSKQLRSTTAHKHACLKRCTLRFSA